MNEAELDRVSELVNIGAGHAASAFSLLTGCTIWTAPPKAFERSRRRLAAGEAGWSTGVFFELDGCLDAIVGILFHEAASEAVVRRVVGITEGELAPHVIESALMEIGNIMASHVASAIADTVGERLLPSIPTLAMNQAERQLDGFVALRGDRHPVRIESRLSDESGELSGLLVMLPAVDE